MTPDIRNRGRRRPCLLFGLVALAVLIGIWYLPSVIRRWREAQRVAAEIEQIRNRPPEPAGHSMSKENIREMLKRHDPAEKTIILKEPQAKPTR